VNYGIGTPKHGVNTTPVAQDAITARGENKHKHEGASHSL